MVHIRFCGLGIPETKWYDLLEESARVLKKGGTLEIVEMAYILPDTVPLSIRNSFSSLLLADMVQPSPNLPIQFNIPTCGALKPTARPVWERTWTDQCLSEAVMAWVRSAMGYKGTGMKGTTGGEEILRELIRVDQRWGAVDEQSAQPGLAGQVSEVTVWAWSVKRI
jgi:hypothetical protein